MESYELEVANPSPYERSGYVQVDLELYGIPPDVVRKPLRLFRIWDNSHREEVPFQIDYPQGPNSANVALSFRAERVPPGPDDYSQAGARFVLEQGKQACAHNACGFIEGFHRNESEGTPPPWRHRLSGIKLGNRDFDFYVSLVPHPGGYEHGHDYTGAITHVAMHNDLGGVGQANEMLSPYGECAAKHWGQVYKLVFFPLPWEMKWFLETPILNHKYEVLWANNGPIRVVLAIRSEPITLQYDGKPFFSAPPCTLRCRLYRVFSIYERGAHYLEELFVLTDSGFSISFRPYFKSLIHFSIGAFSTEFGRQEHVPDYFALWKRGFGQARCYAFASDAHIRGIELESDEIRWRLPLSHHNRCIHQFAFRGFNQLEFDPLHQIGHEAWYESIFKPLSCKPLRIRHAVAK